MKGSGLSTLESPPAQRIEQAAADEEWPGKQRARSNQIHEVFNG
jgi:hypothetical protein